jgi:poly-gamma-glutamate capsule biosynthesis protein CapA/YwtB (metallophosphatase superfamily)
MGEVYTVLRDADITFGNLEGSFAGEAGTPKECKDTTKCFVFRMPGHYVNCLVDAGFDMLSMANNHSNDFGSEGRKETEWVLETHGLAYAGSLSTPYTIVVREGVRYGLIAFAPNKGCYSINDTDQATSMVEQLQSKCDIVIVSVHGGAEGADHQNTPRTSELYLGADRGNMYEFSHLVIDAGADIVFGHGPHVTRAAEVYKDRFIIYSLGNFCTYRRFNLRGPNGIAPILKLKLARDGRFLGGEIFPVYQPGEGGVKPDPHKRVIYKLQDLTRTDFPEAPIVIDDDGKIRPE